MNVACPQCSSVFRVDPAKVPPGGLRARCSICGGVIPVPEPVAELVGGPEAWSAPPYVRQSPPGGSPRMATPAGGIPSGMTPSAGSPAMTTPVPPAPTFATPSAGSSPYVTPAAAAPRVATPAVTRPAMDTPPVGFSTGATSEHPAPEATAAPAAPNEPDAEKRAPINPYLTRDPDVRAKRLARALISDIVTYYPTKHADAASAGTLQHVFREEIKKSYEEYVAQVGQSFADGSSHFQEALNEVLAEGKKIF